jgi:hypothetical protein
MGYIRAMATEPLIDPTDDLEAPNAAQRRMRAEVIHRLQVGLSGLVAMLLLVSLANLITNRASQSEKTAVPDTATSAAATDDNGANKDPLVDAGVVPQLPAHSTDGAAGGSAGANPPPTDSR